MPPINVDNVLFAAHLILAAIIALCVIALIDHHFSGKAQRKRRNPWKK